MYIYYNNENLSNRIPPAFPLSSPGGWGHRLWRWRTWTPSHSPHSSPSLPRRDPRTRTNSSPSDASALAPSHQIRPRHSQNIQERSPSCSGHIPLLADVHPGEKSQREANGEILQESSKLPGSQFLPHRLQQNIRIGSFQRRVSQLEHLLRNRARQCWWLLNEILRKHSLKQTKKRQDLIYQILDIFMPDKDTVTIDIPVKT